jgi:UDP-galactose transporter B1
MYCLRIPVCSTSPSFDLEIRVEYGEPFQFKFDKFAMLASFFKICSAFLATSSLAFGVSFITKTLFKSCKLLPVMAMTVIIGHKTYTTSKYVIVCIMTFGIIMFFTSTEVARESTSSTSIYGTILLLFSLLCNGFTAGLQSRIIVQNSDELMFYMNLYSILYTFIALMVTGQISTAIEFCIKYPSINIDILIYLITGISGQYFIYKTMVSFGILFNSIVTTTRKVFSIFLSVLWFSHSLTGFQWLSIFVVFGALFIDLGAENKEFLEKKQEPIEDEENKENIL